MPASAAAALFEARVSAARWAAFAMPERTFSTVSSALFLAVVEASFNLPDRSDIAVSTGWRTENLKFADSSPIVTVPVSSCQHAEGQFGSALIAANPP